MYAVGYFNTPGPQPHAVFPNVFPDLDMAVDCVIHQIRVDFDEDIDSVNIDENLGGSIVIHWEDAVYVISKLFNFNPKGL